MELPVGYVFSPSDQELVEFLHDKIQGRMDSQTLIFEYDLYGEQEPWDIWNRFRGGDDHNRIRRGGEDLYFFTKLKKVSINGSRITRKVGSGTWSGAYSETICGSRSQYDDSIPIAVKRHFRYENKERPEHDGAWIMHEFSLYYHHEEKAMTTSFNSDAHQFVVICRLRKKYDQAAGNKKGKKRNKFDHHLEPTAVHSNKKMRLSDHSNIQQKDAAEDFSLTCDIEELFEIDALMFSEENKRKESPPITTAGHGDHDEVIADIEKYLFSDQEAINTIGTDDQELDEAMMMNNINSADYFKYNQELKDAIMLDEGNTITTAIPTLPMIADHDHVMEVVEDQEDILKNEFLGNMNFGAYLNGNQYPSFGIGF